MTTDSIGKPAPIPEGTTIPLGGGAVVQMQNLGQSAMARVLLREEKLTELDIRGDIKAATVLNRSPFPLKVETGIWDYIVPPRPFGKAFTTHIIDTCRCVFPYRGNQEMSDKSLQQRFDCKVLLPVHQAMEFKHTYVGESDEDRLLKQGGVVVFEGTMEGITLDSIVRVPTFVYRKGKRYLKFVEAGLKSLIIEADEQMYNHFGLVLEEQSHNWDDPAKRKNIQRNHHTIADFMLNMKKIDGSPAWRNSPIQSKDSCLRCGAQYVSKTGVCKCGYVHDPFLAFMSSEIMVDHVRMNTLTAPQWEKVRAEEKRRADARGVAA